jgi:hypothetical protein
MVALAFAATAAAVMGACACGLSLGLRYLRAKWRERSEEASTQ